VTHLLKVAELTRALCGLSAIAELLVFFVYFLWLL